ncbi:MAG TPA: YgiQ family radical SAM protein [Anaerohalosphaeraceae bacterium]|nr:YgiQ family radical SAM protein [Anaerohalosphaeraceae bacterium]
MGPKKDNCFLPASPQEMRALGWERPDIILITGDAYVDHPAFGVSLIGRWLQRHGFRVVILDQPDWRQVEPFRQFGPPRLFWGITSGCIDSRLAMYASMGHRRKKDDYSPGGRTDLRPDKPLAAYTARCREAFKGIPIVLGGLEASLRRLVHYDYVEDRLKRSILIEAKADLLVFGMAERQILQIARRLDAGQSLADLTDIPGIAYRLIGGLARPAEAVELPGWEDLRADSGLFMKAHLAYQKETHPMGRPVVQSQGQEIVVVNPPAEPLTEEEIDAVYALPFTRCWHPKYDKQGGIAALEPVRFSIATHRGCFGGCSFCSIYFHQGKFISSRSMESILQEAAAIAAHPDFKGTIQDIGGPTANMYGMQCGRKGRACGRSSCICPEVCPYLQADHRRLICLLEALRDWAKSQKRPVRMVVASGIRHDLALRDSRYLELLVREFVGGHLKVAPEHFCPDVLTLMNKPSFEVFEQFEKKFSEISRKAGKKQYLVPYFISGHPGCSTEEAVRLTDYLIRRNWKPRQVQDFVPIPLTLSTAMFVSGCSPQGKPIPIPKGLREKKLQFALLQYYDKANRKILEPFLKEKGLEQLRKQIGYIQDRFGIHSKADKAAHPFE